MAKKNNDKHKHSEEHEDRIEREEQYDLDKTNFDELDETELVKCAKQAREITDLEERVDVGTKLLVGYQKSPFVGHVYLERARDIDLSKLTDLEDDVHKFFDKKKDTLNYNEQTDFFKKLANIVAPPMYIGHEDMPEENWKHLELYLKQVPSASGKEERTAMDDVREALSIADVMKAKQIIVDAVIQYNKHRDFSRFNEELIPLDDRDYWQEIAEPLADRYNKELKKAGLKKVVTPQTLAKDYKTISGALKETAGLALKHEESAFKKKYHGYKPPEDSED